VLRRRRCLVCYWHDELFVAHPYPSGQPVVLHPASAEILTAFDDWQLPATAREQLPALDAESFDNAVATLCQHGLLLTEGTDEARLDERIADRWGPWAPEAPFFHFATAAMGYPPPEGTEADTEAAVDRNHVLFTEFPDADRLLLPRAPGRLDVPYGRVLYGRRTCRDFAPDPVPLDLLSTLLVTVFGPVDYIFSGRSALFRRTSAAGGSRQELDGYIGVRNVTGVTPGLYHYNVREHSLELMAEGLTGAQVAQLCSGQEWASEAAFFVVLVAEIDRMLSKYLIPRCYRVSLLNAGHLGQTFALTATALGLGPFQTGAFDDFGVVSAFGLDCASQAPLYILGAGYPSQAPVMAPPAATVDIFRRSTIVANDQ
jgi:SagB-type dehydrogenase family enzyme